MTVRQRLLSLVVVPIVLLVPGVGLASPPPEFLPTPEELLPGLEALALLALTGVACGLLLARQRPGRVFLGASLIGAAWLGVRSVATPPPFDIPYWGTALQLEAAALAGTALAAWTWGKGAPRSPAWSARIAAALLTVAAAGAWAAAAVRVLTVPVARLPDVPAECGEPQSAAVPELSTPDRWLDHRVATRTGPDGGDELVTAALSWNGGAVELVALREGASGLRTVASAPLPDHGEWLGLTSDARRRVFAAWSAPGGRTVTVARIGDDLRVAQERRVPIAVRGSPSVSASRLVCLTMSTWLPSGPVHHVLALDASLQPVRRLRALRTGLGGARTLAGSIALPAGLLPFVLMALHGLRRRRLVRAAHWHGTLAADGATLEAEDGTRVVVDAPARVLAGLRIGHRTTVVGRRVGTPAGGPYREGATVVRAWTAGEGTFADLAARLDAHAGRVALWAAALSATMALSALDALLGG